MEGLRCLSETGRCRQDYTSSERKVACYMAAKRNQSMRAWAGQASLEELVAKQEAAKEEEKALSHV